MNSPMPPPAALDKLVLRQASEEFRSAHSRAPARDEAKENTGFAQPLLLSERWGLGLSLALHGGNVLYVTARFLLAH